MLFFSFRTFFAVCALFFYLTSLKNLILFLSDVKIIRNAEKGTIEVLQCIFKDLGLCLILVIQHLLMASHWYKDDIGSWFGPCRKAVYIVASFFSIQMMVTYWELIRSVCIWYVDTSERPVLQLFFSILHTIMWAVIILEHVVLYQMPLNMYYFLFGILDHGSSNEALLQLQKYMPHPGSAAAFIILWIHPCMTLDRWILSTILTWLLYLPDRIGKTEYIIVKKISASTVSRTVIYR